MSKPAYLVVNTISDKPEAMAEYRRLAGPVVEQFGGRYIVRGGDFEVLEGGWRPQRMVIVEFPSMAVAKAFYDSPEYQVARKARDGVSDFQMLLVEGY